jgi:hypothetical protein
MIDGGVMRLAARFVQRNVNSGKRHHHRAHHADFVNRPHKIRRWKFYILTVTIHRDGRKVAEILPPLDGTLGRNFPQINDVLGGFYRNLILSQQKY